MGKNKRIWHDHLGNEFESKQSLCDNYEIKVRAFEKRLQRGCSLEDALTTPVPPSNNRNNKIKDPFKKGVYYKSYPELARTYDMNYDTLMSRLEAGVDIKEALTRESRKKKVYDYLGNEFESQIKLCDYYGISRQNYHKRETKGYSAYDILSIPFNIRYSLVFDSYGNLFLDSHSLSNHYKIRNGSTKYKELLGDIVGRRLVKESNSDLDVKYSFKELKSFYELNKDLFWRSHKIVNDDKGERYLVCLLCGSKRNITNMSENDLIRMISRGDSLYTWCGNTCCYNALSSADAPCSPFKGCSTVNMRFTHYNVITGIAYYHFTCSDCGLDDLMSFDDILEHVLIHKIGD